MESNGAFDHFCDADADSFLSRQKLIKLHLPSELRPMTQLNSSADLLRYMELISVKKKNLLFAHIRPIYFSALRLIYLPQFMAFT